MITDREMASSVGRGEERGISPAAAVGDGGGGLDLPDPDLAPGRSRKRRLGSRAPAGLRHPYRRSAGAGRDLRPPTAAVRPPGPGRVPRRVRRHFHDAHGGAGAPVLPRLRPGHAGRVVAADHHQPGVQRRIRAVGRRDLPGRRTAARGRRALLAVGGPIVAFLPPPIGILALLIVGHTLFGASLALSGYALFLSPTGAARQNVGA